jgi:hypothetical protein
MAAAWADEGLLGSPRHGAKIAVQNTIRAANGLVRHSFFYSLLLRVRTETKYARVPFREGTEVVLSCPHAFFAEVTLEVLRHEGNSPFV